MSNSDPVYPVPFPRGVADLEGRFGHVAMTDGIDRVDLQTGELVWSSRVAGHPLIVLGERLAVVAGDGDMMDFRIVQLATSEGVPCQETGWIDASGWGGLPVEDLEVSAHQQDLVLAWRARGGYAGGAPPPPAIESASRFEARVEIRIDLEHGQATVSETSPPSLPPAARQVTSLPYWRKATWHTEPWRAEHRILALVAEGGEVLLDVRDGVSGEHLQEVALPVPGEAAFSVTPDGRYLFAHPASGGKGSFEEVPWWIFSAETGELLSKLSFEEGTHSECVVGGRVFYLVEPSAGTRESAASPPQITLKGRAFSGETLWERPLGEPAFSGPGPLRL